MQEAHYHHEHCAILFRTRAQGRLFEQVLMQRGLPYTLVGDFRFFERREIKDLLAYLRLIHDTFDAGALQRVINRPSRGLGPAALAKLQAGEPELTFAALSGLDARTDLPEGVKSAAAGFAEMVFDDFAPASKTRALHELIDHVLVRSGYMEWVKGEAEAKQRLANLAQLRVLSQHYESAPDALAAFLADIATMGDQDIGIPMETSGITLATIHAVKGLEFPIVFIAGMEEGIFPHAKALKQPNGLEEEQRLAYVGMTRAMTKLYLSYARTRQNGGPAVDSTPSRFIGRLPKELVERVSASVPATVVAAQVVENVPQTVENESMLGIDDINPAAADDDQEIQPATSDIASEPDTIGETRLLQWTGEAEASFLESEVERAETNETSILAGLEAEDTDLKAEILDDGELEVSEALDAWLAEAQRELLEYEMSLAEVAYERERAVSSAADGASRTVEISGEDEPPDFDALLKEYADEIAEHADSERRQADKRPMEGHYAVAE